MIALAYLPQPDIIIIVVFAGYETYKRWQLRRSGSPEQRPTTRSAAQSRAGRRVYLGLVAGAGRGHDATHLVRTLG